MHDHNEGVAAELNGAGAKRAWSTPHIIVSMMADAQIAQHGTHHDGSTGGSNANAMS